MTNILNLVLHPGLKLQYCKTNKWPQRWQDEAIQITRRIFNEDYKDFGMADERSASSVNVAAHTQGNEVSEINIFTYLLTLDIEKYLPFGDACPNGWKFSG